MDKHTDRKMDEWKNRQAVAWMDGQTDGQTRRWIDRRQDERKYGKMTERHTDT